MRTLILFYSAYGHIYTLAKSVREGVLSIKGTDVDMKRVPETLPENIQKSIGVWDAQKKFSDVPILKMENIEELAAYDAIIFGTPTRFGNMCGQMRSFLDAASPLWIKDALVGKAGSVFTSSATQHGGQESTCLNFHITLLHLGFVVVGLPYSFKGQNRIDEITGGSPYGASTITGGDGSRQPSANELEAARFQGAHVASIALKLAGK
jgi:NAD(P)H dehydrogenase (quinone)